MRFSHLLGRLGLLTTGVLLAACHCPIKDSYQMALQADSRLRSVEPQAVDYEDGCQIGLGIKLAALQRVLDEAQKSSGLLLKKFQKELDLIPGLGGNSVSAKISAQVDSLAFKASSECQNCLQLDVGYRLIFSLTIPDLLKPILKLAKDRFELPGQMSLVVGLDVQASPAGGTVLRLDLSRPAVSAFDFVLEFLPEDIAQVLDKQLRGLAVAIARATLSDFQLLAVRPIDLDVGKINTLLVWLRVEPKHNQLFLGLMTNLNLPAALNARPMIDRELATDMLVRIDSELPGYVVRALLANGDIPRRYTKSIEPDEDGPIGITLTRLAFAANSLAAHFRLWHLAWPCFTADLIARANFVQNGNKKFVANLEEIVLEKASRFEDRIKKKLLKQSRFAQALKIVSERLLNQRYLDLPGQLKLVWKPVDYKLEKDLIEIGADLDFDQAAQPGR
jgi:hypothetical protein